MTARRWVGTNYSSHSTGAARGQHLLVVCGVSSFGEPRLPKTARCRCCCAAQLCATAYRLRVFLLTSQAPHSGSTFSWCAVFSSLRAKLRLPIFSSILKHLLGLEEESYIHHTPILSCRHDLVCLQRHSLLDPLLRGTVNCEPASIVSLRPKSLLKGKHGWCSCLRHK